MKRDWLVIAVLAFVLLLLVEAAGLAILQPLLRVISGWLLVLPGPSGEWATILAAWAWPTALLVLAYLLRKPLGIAAHHLARRLERDRIKVGGFLEIDAATSLIALNETERDSKVIETLWEFAGTSDENWIRLLAWIAQRVAPSVEVEDFLSEGIFAPERELAYKELVEGM